MRAALPLNRWVVRATRSPVDRVCRLTVPSAFSPASRASSTSVSTLGVELLGVGLERGHGLLDLRLGAELAPGLLAALGELGVDLLDLHAQLVEDLAQLLAAHPLRQLGHPVLHVLGLRRSARARARRGEPGRVGDGLG